jgi:hypothetical protein
MMSNILQCINILTMHTTQVHMIFWLVATSVGLQHASHIVPHNSMTSDNATSLHNFRVPGLPRAHTRTHKCTRSPTFTHALSSALANSSTCRQLEQVLTAVGAGADGSGTHSTLTHSLAHSSSIFLPPPPSSPSRYLTSHNTCAISRNIVQSCRTADTS